MLSNALTTALLLTLSVNTPSAGAEESATAVFAGGCFWCMEPPFEKLDGVTAVVSGYTGGTLENPTYEQVSAGKSGHTEAVQIIYDPKQISYAELLKVFWKNIDPLDSAGQFCDKGPQYRSGIYYQSDAEKRAAEESRNKLTQMGPFKGKAIATEIIQIKQFYPAEEYHQDYYKKNPLRYRFYRLRCGRDQRLKTLWGNPAQPSQKNIR
jgi:peptide-methionine (S)-S-oxide reductase